MKIFNIRNVITIIGLLASLLLIVQYQNCTPSSAGGAMNLGSNSSTSAAIPFSASALSLPSSILKVSDPMVASSQLYGKDSDQPAQCVWSIIDLATKSQVGSTLTSTASGGTCSLPSNALFAPPGVGNFLLVLVATNSSLESASAQAIFQTQTTAVGMSVANSLNASVVSGVYLNDVLTFTGRANSNQAGNLSVQMGFIASGVKTPFSGSGCSASGTGVTSVQASCPVTMSTTGVKYFYVDSYLNGVLAKSCTASTVSPNLSCTGNFMSSIYEISVATASGGGGGGACLLSTCKPSAP